MPSTSTQVLIASCSMLTWFWGFVYKSRKGIGVNRISLNFEFRGKVGDIIDKGSDLISTALGFLWTIYGNSTLIFTRNSKRMWKINLTNRKSEWCDLGKDSQFFIPYNVEANTYFIVYYRTSFLSSLFFNFFLCVICQFPRGPFQQTKILSRGYSTRTNETCENDVLHRTIHVSLGPTNNTDCLWPWMI